MAIASLKGTVESLQRVFAAAQSTQPADVQKTAEKLAFPDPEMVAKVASFLPSTKVNAQLSQEDVSDALVKYMANEIDHGAWGASVRDASRRVGGAFLQLHEAVQELKMGINPALLN